MKKMATNVSSTRYAIGTGLICLDAIEDRDRQTYRLVAGGSCLNVLAILHWLGWDTTIVGQVGADRAGGAVLDDLQKLGIDCRHIHRRSTIGTPIYIERIAKEGHTFSHACPDCNQKFSDFEPVEEETVRGALAETATPLHVAYIDRVSTASVTLAESCKQRGALVYFEPNRMGDQRVFLHCLEHADILKYSGEKLPGLKDSVETQTISLVIETAGSAGLTYRWQGVNDRETWRQIPGVECERFVDAAGAGDWLSAALLDRIATDGQESFREMEASAVLSTLLAAQEVAASACETLGARGQMYEKDPLETGDDFCPYCGPSS